MTREKIFYRIGREYWAEVSDAGLLEPKLLRLARSATAQEKLVVADGSSIAAMTGGIGVSTSTDYLLYETERVLAFREIHRAVFRWKETSSLNAFKFEVCWRVEQFRRKRWQSLTDQIYAKESNVKSVLEALKAHTFSEHYSLWLYNEQTSQFHLHCASFRSEKVAIERGNGDETLGRSLDRADSYEFGTVTSGVVNSAALEGMRSLNRFHLKPDIDAVLTFYSPHESFEFNSRTAKLVPRIVEAKLFDELAPNYLSKHRKVREVTSRYELGQLDDFLATLARKVTTELGWEAVSVFLRDSTDGSEQLRLRAVAANGHTQRDLPKVSYLLDDKSLTSRVCTSGKVIGSYDISHDPHNSHTYDEPTATEPKNWVGVPIMRADHRVNGVLRAKNRTEGVDVVPFNSIDIRLLESVASVIAYLLHLEEIYTNRQNDIREQLQATNEENRQLNEFLKTFRHELRSPLTVITQASNTIERQFELSGMATESSPLPKKVREVLHDLDAVGSRLVLVTNFLTFDAHELVQERKKTRIFFDVAAPILAFSTEYARRRKRTIRVNKDSLFLDGYCDPQSASMVFHMILDNAIKYSRVGSTITVTGKPEPTYVCVAVESTGIAIREEEEEDIFRRYYRGAEARAQKIEGSGIGLYLAREIMTHNFGSIIFLRQSGRNVFEIRFPRFRN